MKKKNKKNSNTRVIILSVLSIVLVIVLAVGITYAYMKPVESGDSITEVSLSSCAKITLTSSSSITLSSSYPMSRNRALENTPYTFTVTSSCETDVGFNLYLGVLSTNTLDASSIHYIITAEGDSSTVIAEGIVGDKTDVYNDFSNSEIAEYNTGVGGTVTGIYLLYSEDFDSDVTYDLYLYVDSDIESSTSTVEVFEAGIAVKSYDR